MAGKSEKDKGRDESSRVRPGDGFKGSTQEKKIKSSGSDKFRKK